MIIPLLEAWYLVTTALLRIFYRKSNKHATMVRKNNKRKQQQVDQDKAVKKLRKAVVEELALKLIEHQTYNKENNISRKDSYGVFQKLINEKYALMPWLNLKMVHKKASRIKKKKKALDEEVQQETVQQERPDEEVQQETVQQETSSNKRAGRPKGATNEAKIDIEKKKEQARVLLTERYREARQEHTGRLPDGLFNEMHANVLEEVGLCGTGISINYKSIRWRFQHNVSRTKRGPAPPAEAIEAYLITIAAWKQDIGEPMDKDEMIDLANSMIMGSKLQAAVEKHHQISQVQPTRLLGDQWYANYKRRHKEVLNTGKGTRQHSVRREWCTYHNFEDMYQRVYEQLVLSGIAKHLPENEHFWVDTAGCRVDSENKAAGHKCTMEMKHPDYLLFGDEVGSDTAQDGDGHIGGKTYITIGNRRIELASSKSSNRFTLIDLTAANGDPVMCIVIIAGKEIGVEDALGYDYQSKIPYDTNKTLEENVVLAPQTK